MDAIQNHSQNAINTLLLNASFIDNIGLMHGKMGISIFFFHLARKTQNQIYEDYAGELIDEIYEEIDANTPVDFENGLAGIGWGIEYLVQNKFIEANTDEVLEDFDNRIFKELIYNTPIEIDLLNGIIGIGAYFLKRIQPVCRAGRNPKSNNENIPALTNKQSLILVIDELERQTQDISETIRETQTNVQTIELSNDTQTIKQSNNNPSHIFDITWNYPFLLWVLAELYEQNIFNFKVEKLIQRLVEPLSNSINLPKLQSNRLLLALALTKIQQSLKLLNAETIATNLFIDLNRETIKSELLPNNSTVKHGASGIALIYRQLFKLTKYKGFKKEMEYWMAQIPKTSSYKENYFELDGINKFNNAQLGIIEGLAGLLLMNLYS